MREVKADLGYQPIMLAGVGGGKPTRWLYSEFGQFLSATNRTVPLTITFDTKNHADIDLKVQKLHDLVSLGSIEQADVTELEERLRLMSGVDGQHNEPRSQTAIGDFSKKIISTF